MSTIGNILWFLFGGLIGGLAWVLAGCLWCITIIGIRWPAMLQIRKSRLFSVWEGSCVWRWRLFFPRQPNLDHFLWP